MNKQYEAIKKFVAILDMGIKRPSTFGALAKWKEDRHRAVGDFLEAFVSWMDTLPHD